jgi:hypothetical protein
LRAVIERSPVLWLGLLAYPPAELQPFVTESWINFIWISAGLLCTTWFLILTFPTIQRNKHLQFLLVGAVLATLPVCSSLPANRLLFFIGLGVMPVLATYLTDPGGRALPKKWIWSIHLALAMVMLPWTSYSPKLFGNIEETVLAAPIKPTVVIVSAPSAFHADFFGLIRRRYGVGAPERILNLGAGLSPMEITRMDANTLLVTRRQSFISGFDAVFRGYAHLMSQGTIVSLNGIQITVREITWDGRPTLVEFHFAEPLESLNYQWLVWTYAGLVKWEIPKIGESDSIP